MRSTLLLLLCFYMASAQGQGAIDSRFSGSWYDPTHDGEGLLLEVLPDDRALLYWFTYDEAGNQLWLMSVGNIEDSQIHFEEVLAPRGARFGEDFNAADVVLEAWGELTLSFEDCNSGQLAYDGALGSGSQTLVRLSSIAGLECGAGAKTLNSSLSAAWFDPARVGEGFLIEVLGPDQVLVYWFTYDTEGGPMWVVGEGVTERNRVLVESSVSTRGGRFGPEFDPATVERIPFGPMAFAFNGTGSAGAMTFLGPEGFGAGDMNLVRLTQLEGTVIGFDGESFGISGMLAVSPNMLIDGDVNDPGIAAVPNNTAATAQELPNPVRLAGFASAAPAGLPGSRFAVQTDDNDVYAITLSAGQALTLEITAHDADDSAAHDLDLYLFDPDDLQTPVAQSLSLNAREELVAPADGDYLVLVNAFEGASGYVLATAEGGVSAAAATAEMVPWQAIVTLHEGGGKSSWTQSLTPRGVALSAGDPSREMLVELAGTPKRTAVAAASIAAAGLGAGSDARWQTLLAIKHLQSDAAVRIAEPNYVYATQVEPGDTLYGFQWHYPLVRLPEAWDITIGSKDVVVSVIDTGVGAHPDNAANVDFSLGFDFVSRPLEALDRDGIDADADDPGDRSNADGTGSYHGTHVAGTIGADSDNDNGLAGVAWDVTLMPVRVLGRGGSGSGFDIIQGFRWSAGLDNDSGMLPARRADIINMSLGGPGFSQTMAEAVQEARAAGVTVVAAAGNSNIDDPFYPAAYEGVVSVAATTISDSKAPYSNFGPTIDIAAPGGDSSTDVNGDGFGDGVLSLLFDDSSSPRSAIAVFYNGTSMAAPHVAGIAALMKSVYPEMTPEEFDQAIMSGGITVDLAGNGATIRDDNFGYGRIDALAAVQWAQARASGEPIAALLSASPGMLQFGPFDEVRDLQLSNAGEGELQITALNADQPWILIAEEEIDEDGLGRYRISIDRTELPLGRQLGEIVIDSSAGDTAVVVSADVGDLSVPGQFGTAYMLLIDPLTGGVLGETAVSEGDDQLVFQNVLPGEYLLIGGTDLDNDGRLCEPGELCGGFPELSDLAIIEIEDDDFDAGQIILSLPVSIATSDAATLQRR